MTKRNSIISLVRAALCAALIAVSSFIIIPLSVIPVTLQTFTVCAVAGLLGAKWGLAAVSVYVMLGALGLPVFSGFGGGIGVLLGAGGGYIWGFFLIALTVGVAADKFGAKFSIMAFSMGIGMLLCYVAGSLWYTVAFSSGEGLLTVLSACIFPFILPDAVKIIAAAALVSKIKKRIHTK